MATFVHTADIHFDTPFSARFSPKKAELRRKELMQTFREIVTAAGERDFLFISGDLFDGRFVSAETVAFLKRCFKAISKTKILISAGNHDPLIIGSAYMDEDWGENVYIFGKDMEYIDFPELNTRVHGISFKDTHQEEELFNSVDIHDEWCNILVIHGAVGASDGSRYNPIDKTKIEKSGLDYIALGHIHKHDGIQKIGNTVYAYPGIPEGRGFDETGEKGFIIGTAVKGEVSATWEKASRREFLIESIDVSESEDSLHILELVEERIEKNGTENIFRIVLTGKVDKSLINTDLLNEQLKEKAFYVEIKDETKPDYILEDIVAEGGLKGEFVSALLGIIKDMPDNEKEIGYMAIEIGIEAMERGHNS